MFWFWLVVIGGVFGGVRPLLSRVILRDEEESLTYSFIYQALSTVLIVPIFAFGVKLPKTFLPFVTLLSLGLFETLTVYLFMEAARLLEVSFRKIISQTQIIWVLIFGVIFFQESLDLAKVLGVFSIFLGVTLAIFKKQKVSYLKNLWLRFWDREGTLKEKGIIFALIAAILGALEVIVIKYLLNYFSPSVMIFGVRGVSAICFLLFLKNLKPQVKSLVKRKPNLIFLHGLVGSLATFFFLWATSLTEVSRTVPISQSFSILTVFGGIMFLKERGRIWQKVLGGILAVIGVVLVKGS